MIFRKVKLVGAVPAAPVAAVAVAVLIPLIGCSNVVKHGPSFPPTGLTVLVGSQPIDRLVLVDGQAIDPITLPEAMGGSGEFTYSLTPEVPGLTFDPATRIWSGTPAGARTTARTHDVTYTATDADGDSVSVAFTVTVKPTLWGTWRSVLTRRDWDDDSRIIGRTVDTLTFTSDRFIQHSADYDLGGNLLDNYAGSGTWSMTDTTMTRTTLEDHDDDDSTPRVRTSVVKDYLWADTDRSTLLVHFWWDLRTDVREFQAFERVDTALPPPLAGTWSITKLDEEDPYRWTIVIGEDRTIMVTDEEVPWTKTAKWTLDQDHYSLELTEASDVEWKGARIAFAPTDQYPDGIVVSFPWDESESEYGCYCHDFTRRK